MIKENKTALLLLGSLGILSSAQSFALSALQQQQQNLQQQMLQTAQTSAQQRQARLNAQLEAQKITDQQQYNAAVNAAAHPGSQPAAPQNTPTSCDCYTQSDAYNMLSNNFYYNQNHFRVARINPACQCLAPTQSQLAAMMAKKQPVTPVSVVNSPSNTQNNKVSVTPLNNNAATASPQNNNNTVNNTSPAQFNIKYN